MLIPYISVKEPHTFEKEIKPMLEDGRVLATADQAAAEQAVYGIQTALKLLKKEPVENLKDGVIDTPVQLVTKK